MSGPARRLAVRVDGEVLPEDAAVAMWERFSAHMEANKGDLAGFAAKEGFASVRPSFDASGAVLLASKSAAQEPYANARAERGGATENKAAGGESAGHARKRRRRR